MLLSCLAVVGIIPQAKQSTVHFGMQGLYPPIHHFRKPGMVAYIGNRYLLLP